jgi:hypothetical protein
MDVLIEWPSRSLGGTRHRLPLQGKRQEIRSIS